MSDLREVELAVVPLRDSVLFPHVVQPITVGRTSSMRLLDAVDAKGALVAVLTQRASSNADGDVPVYEIGTCARVHTVTKSRHEPIRYVMLVEGIERVRLMTVTQREPYMKARFEILPDVVPVKTDEAFEALRRNVRDLFCEIIARSPTLSNDLIEVVEAFEDPSTLTDFASGTYPFLELRIRQELLETLDVRARMQRLVGELVKERDRLVLEHEIQEEIRQKTEGAQREYLLREQLKLIQHELGENDQATRDVAELRRRIDDARMPDEPKREAERELARLQNIPAESAEYGVARTYLELVTTLPWSRSTAQPVDIKRAQQILDEDHYDLEKVKERILEYLAVRQLKPDLKGPILCFVGPPGVGKTSLGKSIARALGRRFARLSLGGMHDEAEIRGHRRTYVGALPGQILQSLRRVGSNDPVFMLDEIDKVGKDFRGDPAAALLEVLDPEQNVGFRDHYLDVPFDLSRVLFITTANILDPVAPALLDRMEVLELSGYTDEEKLHIARRYLVPRQVEQHGLALDTQIRFSDDAIMTIVRNYTHEAGVRNLERGIASVCRKHAKRIASDGAQLLAVNADVVRELLGAPAFRVETQVRERCSRPGVAIGLAWTPYGGELLFVEAARMPRDKGEFTVTGQLGQVMQESTKAALTWLRANARALGLDADDFKRYDVHLHVPGGAVPKDGPSAGVVMVAALFSLFADRTVRPSVAMSGEITLSGELLPVGGIKEKVLAARRSGIRELILPADNEPNVLEDVPRHLREGLTFHFVRTIEEAMAQLFAPAPVRRPSERLIEAGPNA